MKTILIVLAVLLTGGLSYAGNGDLVVNGRLGIGTTSPGGALDIASIGSNGVHAQLNTGNSDTIPFLFSGSGGTGDWANSTHGFAWFYRGTDGNLELDRKSGSTSGSQVLTVRRDNGNVGIGTTQPSSILNVDPHGPGWILVGNPNTGAGGFTSLSIGISAQSGGYSSLQSVKSSGAAWGDIVLNGFGGNVAIGTSNYGSGGSGALLFGNGSKPGAISEAAGLYTQGNVLCAFDAYGNDTVISPHAADAPEALYDLEDGVPMMVKEVQYFLGYVRYTNQTRQAKLAGMTDAEKQQLSPARRTCVIKETFVEHEARTGERLTQLIWEEEQTKIKQMKDAERQALIEEKDRLAASAEAKDKEVAAAKGKNKAELQKESGELRGKLKSIRIPEEYVMQPLPPRLQAALGR